MLIEQITILDLEYPEAQFRVIQHYKLSKAEIEELAYRYDQI
jgi:hypothetical protein